MVGVASDRADHLAGRHLPGERRTRPSRVPHDDLNRAEHGLQPVGHGQPMPNYTCSRLTTPIPNTTSDHRTAASASPSTTPNSIPRPIAQGIAAWATSQQIPNAIPARSVSHWFRAIQSRNRIGERVSGTPGRQREGHARHTRVGIAGPLPHPVSPRPRSVRSKPCTTRSWSSTSARSTRSSSPGGYGKQRSTPRSCRTRCRWRSCSPGDRQRSSSPAARPVCTRPAPHRWMRRC